MATLVRELGEAEAALQAHLEGQADAILDAGGHPVLLREAQASLISSEAAQRQAAEMQAAILDAVPAHIALVDAAGAIVAVNEPWRRFATVNALQSAAFGVGQNYLEVCERASGECSAEAAEAARGLRSVLRGEEREFALEYPCHSPGEERWYRLMITPLSADRLAGAVVMHINITERKRLEEQQSRLVYDLGERVKELRVLHQTAEVLRHVGLSNGDVLAQIVLLLPPAMQFPDIAAARVVFESEERTTAGFRMTPWCLQADFGTGTGKGCLQIVYLEERRALPEGPFMAEERHLINALGEMLGAYFDRQATAEALRESEERFRGLLQSVPTVAIQGYALDGTVQYWNAASEKFYGYTHDEALGGNLLDLIIPPEMRDGVREALRGVAEEGRDIPHNELYLQRKDGSRILVYSSHAVVRRAGHPPELFCIDIDLSERQRAEEERRVLSERLVNTLESITDGFLTLGPDWTITYVNREAERMLQITRGELLGRNLWEKFPEAIGGNFHREYERALAENVAVSIEEYYPPLKTWFEARAYPSGGGLAVYLRDVTAGRAAREQLRISEQRFREMAENIGDVFFNFDPAENRLLYANAAYERIWGRPLAEIYANPLSYLESIHPQDRPAAERAFAAQREGKETGVEFRIVRPDGSIRWVREQAVPVRDETGRVERIVGTMHDITEAKRADWEVARANGALRMLSRCKEAVIRADSERGLLTEVCQIAVEVEGFRMAWVGFAQDDEHRSIVPQAHAGVEDGYLSAIRLTWADELPVGQGPGGRTIRTGEPTVLADLTDPKTSFYYREEARARGFHGVICLPLKDGQRTFGFLALYLDEARSVPADELSFLQELANDLAFGILTFRVRAERMIAQERMAQQAALLDQAQDAILVQDLEHRITYWNRSAVRLYGWPVPEAMGRRLDELLQVDAEKFAEARRQVLEAGEWNGEIQLTAKNQAVLTADGRWTLLRHEGGQPKAILTIDTDITERKKLEQQFLRAQRMESVGTLAGGIAHDMNNLLAPIVMGVGLLRQFTRDEVSLQVIQNIERSARRGTDLVKQVLSFARGVDGARVAIALRHIVNEIEAIAQNTFPKNITFEFDVPKDLWLVTGDPTQLNQVLLNLCVNARDAMPGGGRLTVTVRNLVIDEQYAVMNRGVVAGRYVRVEVMDTGCGMPKEVVERIFEPFFTTKEMGKGTGLGLSTVMGIVRSHGGFVNVYSELGKGSVFKVYLPAPAGTAIPVAAEAADQPRLPRGHGELVLVVDDEASVRDITQQTLEAFGYRVVTAEDGAQAIGLYALHRDDIAVVLTDMMMPVMDGSALIAALRRIDPEVRIIAASGLQSHRNLSHAGPAGVKHFLAKPYTAETLLTLLRTAIGREGSRRPL